MQQASLQQLISFLDLTSLNATDTQETIAHLCQQAITPYGDVAAVCIFPEFIKQAKALLNKSSVKVATVINFPGGDEPLDSCISTIFQAIQDGADELDIVMPYQTFLQNEKKQVRNFLAATIEKCNPKTTKIILETGALIKPELIREATLLAAGQGAHFIKTSTGKIPVGATVEAAEIILQTLKEMPATYSTGLKVSGGVREVNQAQTYVELCKTHMGDDWLSNAHFRIGASSLLGNILKQLPVNSTG